jgi:hypothetical protein
MVEATLALAPIRRRFHPLGHARQSDPAAHRSRLAAADYRVNVD